MKNLIALSALVLAACSGEAPRKFGDGTVDVSSRAATQTECPYGGYVLSIDDQDIPVCDGKNGVDGKPGATGATGPAGAEGATGLQGPVGTTSTSNVIQDTILCQGNDGTTFVSAYTWVIDPKADANDNIAICSIGEGAFQETSEFIGNSCNLISPLHGVITITAGATFTLSGGMTGTLVCN